MKSSKPHSNMHITPTERQYRFWEKLVECVFEACQIDNNEYSADSKNLADAIITLNKAWKLICRLPQIPFDYAIYRRKLTALGHFAIKRNDYKNAVEVANSLREIGKQCLSDEHPRRINPSDIALDIVELGIAAVIAGKDALENHIFITLLDFYYSAENGCDIYLLYALNLMAVILENNRFAKYDLSERVKNIGKSAIKKTLEYGTFDFPREVARIKWLLKEVDEIIKDTTPPFSKKKGSHQKKKTK